MQSREIASRAHVPLAVERHRVEHIPLAQLIINLDHSPVEDGVPPTQEQLRSRPVEHCVTIVDAVVEIGAWRESDGERVINGNQTRSQTHSQTHSEPHSEPHSHLLG